MQVTKGTWRMRKQCVPGSLSSSPAQEPGNKAKEVVADDKTGFLAMNLVFPQCTTIMSLPIAAVSPAPSLQNFPELWLGILVTTVRMGALHKLFLTLTLPMLQKHKLTVWWCMNAWCYGWDG